MARKTTAQEPKEAKLTAEQMRSAIPKLQRRIADLQAFEPASLKDRRDPRVKSLETKLEDTVAEIFGHDTVEYERFRPRGLDNASLYVGRPTPMHEVVQSATQGRAREIANLETIIELFNEKLMDDGESPATRARRAFGELDLHPEIARASAKLFEDGHYAEAVENGCKVLDMLVKLRSTRTEPSGTELMQLVFSPKSPVLKFNDQVTESERSEQQGMMYLFAGAMLALRNPRAHGVVNDHPESALEYLSFISMLAKSLDRTKN